MPPRTYRSYRKRPMARRGPRKGYRTYRRLRYSRRKTYQRVVEFKKTCSKTWTSNSNATPGNSGFIAPQLADQSIQYTFQLSDLPNYTEITKLYDMYKIKSIRLRLVPLQNSNDVNPTASLVQSYPVHSVLDFTDTDISALSGTNTLNDYLEYSTYKMTKGLREHKRFFYPKQLQYAADGGVSTVADVKNNWVRSESPGIDHLGVKIFIPGSTVANQLYYQVFATYYILARNSK